MRCPSFAYWAIPINIKMASATIAIADDCHIRELDYMLNKN